MRLICVSNRLNDTGDKPSGMGMLERQTGVSMRFG